MLGSYYTFILIFLSPVFIATFMYHLDPLEPAELPLHELSKPETGAARVNNNLLKGAEFIGVGKLVGPEDIAFDPISDIIYTGCSDGWIKRVRVNDSVVDDWVFIGGRPLGLALGLNNELIVADPFQGLLNVSAEGKVELLTDEVEGRKLKFADGVDVAKDGMIYFSEASYKYGLPDFIFDVFEGKPHGSLLSFDPITKETKVLVRDLYFANGVQISADQKSVIFCEIIMYILKRCKKYIREVEKQGILEHFVDNLPGMPDNIRYDDKGHYWVAFSTSPKPYWDIALRYPFIRKGLAIITRYIGRSHMEKNGGLGAFDLEGNLVAHYYDPKLTMISGGNKIGNYLYVGSLHAPHILRLNLAAHAAK
ncbi:protein STRICTOSIDINE SYNTHASE-LIKE 7-like [Chenopodium quinoa]|uniref:protein STRICTOSIDINE SYNTHASE-LIKE 7-like n=1 Tax=Chenopodium quinoa TaxID=63459 RepID=UPI000B78888B|nr:protein STRICTOSIDINE SYNTHASE-LIKE 7-like [Chenopodium quinoa]